MLAALSSTKDSGLPDRFRPPNVAALRTSFALDRFVARQIPILGPFSRCSGSGQKNSAGLSACAIYFCPLFSEYQVERVKPATFRNFIFHSE